MEVNAVSSASSVTSGTSDSSPSDNSVVVAQRVDSAAVILREIAPEVGSVSLSIRPEEDIGHFMAEREICNGVWIPCKLDKTEMETSKNAYKEVRKLVKDDVDKLGGSSIPGGKFRVSFDLASNIIYHWDARDFPPQIKKIYAHDPNVSDAIRAGIEKLAHTVGVTEMPLKGAIGVISNPGALALTIGDKGHPLRNRSAMTLEQFATDHLSKYLTITNADLKSVMKKLSRAETYVKHMKDFATTQIAKLKAKLPRTGDEDKALHKLEAKIKLLEEIDMYAVFEALAREGNPDQPTAPAVRAAALAVSVKEDLAAAGLAKDKKWHLPFTGRIMTDSENEYAKVVASLTIRNIIEYQEYMDIENLTTLKQKIAERAAIDFADKETKVDLFGDLPDLQGDVAVATQQLSSLATTRENAIEAAGDLNGYKVAHNETVVPLALAPSALPVASGLRQLPPGAGLGLEE